MPRVTSRKQFAANRNNAAHSTGPTSPDGKAIVAHNALRHGLYADAVVLNSRFVTEDQDEFDALLARFHADLKPETELERACIERMAACCWRARRAYKFEVTVLERAARFDREESARCHLPDEDEMDQLLRYEAMLDRQLSSAHQRFLVSRQNRRIERNDPSLAPNAPIPPPTVVI